MSDEQPAGDASPALSHGLRGYRATEIATFSEFYRHFTPKIVAFLLTQGATLADATEVTQFAMLEAWQNWDDIRSPQAWVRTVAGRALVRRFASLETPVLEFGERTALVPDDLQISAWERRYDLLRILKELPSRQRQVMSWTLAEYTPTEIAAILQITPEAVRSNLRKARRSIAMSLKLSEE
ncbi:RNA polymerase sigma factor [Nocardia fusca]|uniref:RNA polymerase sigma factor n=1 Tax=Nocardia fusca TaxID=941183 RepID=UPI0007A75B00|nr:sigma-70 family RNA polymerase sigma factor [Nocardia fusca]